MVWEEGGPVVCPVVVVGVLEKGGWSLGERGSVEMSRLLPRIDPWPPLKRFVGLAWREGSPTTTPDGEVLLPLLRDTFDGLVFVVRASFSLPTCPPTEPPKLVVSLTWKSEVATTGWTRHQDSTQPFVPLPQTNNNGHCFDDCPFL